MFHPTGAPGPCSEFVVESELLICFCYFVCMIVVTLCSLLCMSVFHVWSSSLDCILLITAITVVSLITLSINELLNVIFCSTFEFYGNSYLHLLQNRGLMHHDRSRYLSKYTPSLVGKAYIDISFKKD